MTLPKILLATACGAAYLAISPLATADMQQSTTDYLVDEAYDKGQVQLVATRTVDEDEVLSRTYEIDLNTGAYTLQTGAGVTLKRGNCTPETLRAIIENMRFLVWDELEASYEDAQKAPADTVYSLVWTRQNEEDTVIEVESGALEVTETPDSLRVLMVQLIGLMGR